MDAFRILSWYVFKLGICITGFGGSVHQSGFVTLSFCIIEYLTGKAFEQLGCWVIVVSGTIFIELSLALPDLKKGQSAESTIIIKIGPSPERSVFDEN